MEATHQGVEASLEAHQAVEASLEAHQGWRLWRRVVHAPVQLEAEAGVVHAPVQVEAEAEVEAKLRDLLHRFPVAEADHLPEVAHQAL